MYLNSSDSNNSGLLALYANAQANQQRQEQQQAQSQQQSSGKIPLGGLLALAHRLYGAYAGSGASTGGAAGVGAESTVMPEIAGPSLEAPTAGYVGAEAGGAEAGAETAGAGAADTGAASSAGWGMAAGPAAFLATAPIWAPYVAKAGDWAAKKLGVWSPGGNRPWNPEEFANSNTIASQYSGWSDLPLAQREAIANQAHGQGFTVEPGRAAPSDPSNPNSPLQTTSGLGQEAFRFTRGMPNNIFTDGPDGETNQNYDALFNRQSLAKQVAMDPTMTDAARTSALAYDQQIKDAIANNQGKK